MFSLKAPSICFSKNEIADYLMGKYDEGMIIYQNPINERSLLMSYLPFIESIGVNPFPQGEKKGNWILLKFESSSICNPSDTYVEVSDELYKFLSKNMK